jgi:predicted DNA binding CopG/RHH family protein
MAEFCLYKENSMKKKLFEIKDYDQNDTTAWINSTQKLSLKDLGFKLPPVSPTQVVSIRLPTALLNQLRAKASAQDISYQGLIKIILANSFRENKLTAVNTQ